MKELLLILLTIIIVSLLTFCYRYFGAENTTVIGLTVVFVTIIMNPSYSKKKED